MELKVIEQKEGRRWISSLSDQEMYELLCTACAWRVLNGNKMKLKPDPELIADVEIITVALVDRSSKTDAKDKIEGIPDPFLRMVLGEINRLRIHLPDGEEIPL